MGYFENIISQKISNASGIDSEELMQFIEIPPNAEMGDFAFPCFKLAKVMKKSPMAIAEELKLKLDEDLGSEIDKLEIVNGYLNFYINRVAKVKYVFNQIDEKKDTFGSNNSGNGKNILIEYSSPNIAKPFHIGHLRNTIIGNSLYNIYKFMGYNTISINHLGDYGTQFGKLIEGIKRWENEYNIAENPIEELSKIYIRINELCKEDESVLDACRENFRLLENGDSYCVSLWEKIKTLSIEEFDKIYDLLNVKFDKVLGESFYVDKIDDVVNDLKQANVLVESQGAMIIDMEDKGLGVLIVIKSNESSIYATRDLAAIKYRAQTFDFDKCLYVVGSEQNTYFKQLFEAAKYLNISEKCKENLYHVQYGMVRLPSGKMSTRLGNTITVKQLLDETINRVDKIIEENNPDM
jgi:arginyl-tRNA synthetase